MPQSSKISKDRLQHRVARFWTPREQCKRTCVRHWKNPQNENLKAITIENVAQMLQDGTKEQTIEAMEYLLCTNPHDLHMVRLSGLLGMVLENEDPLTAQLYAVTAEAVNELLRQAAIANANQARSQIIANMSKKFLDTLTTVKELVRSAESLEGEEGAKKMEEVQIQVNKLAEELGKNPI